MVLPVCLGQVKRLVQCEFIICSVKRCIILLTHCKFFVKSLVFSMLAPELSAQWSLQKTGI